MVTKLPDDVGQQSEIKQQFSGCTVFLTGATGFLGMLFLEKLLRAFPDINRVLILIRKKKGKSIEDRLSEVQKNPLFDRLRNTQPKFSDKIIALIGDCALPNLGLCQIDRKLLIKEVNCIFHCAATVRFDEKLQIAANINIRATRDLLNIAKSMNSLKSFVYVSTAYSNCNRKEIHEEFYPPPITGDKLLTLVSSLDEEILQSITPGLLGSWPNTYSFTKAVAEEVVKSCGKDLPVAVVRPSIVFSTIKEPVPGWSSNLFGANGAIMGISSGLIRAFNCKMNAVADIVPADYVINCCIAAAWDVATNCVNKLEQGNFDISSDACFEDNTLKPDYKIMVTEKQKYDVNEESSSSKPKRVFTDIPIYNYVSGTESPVTWREVIGLGRLHYRNTIPSSRIWHHIYVSSYYYFLYGILKFLLHTIPAHAIDLLRRSIGKEPKFRKMYHSINKLLDAVSYFGTKEWEFQNNNTQALWGKLNAEDKRLFCFDLRSFDWSSYLEDFIIGTRRYLLTKHQEPAQHKAEY